MNKQIKRAFNNAALTYDEHCHLQIHTGEKLLAELKIIKSSANNIIDMGCGTGINTVKLAEQYEYQQLHAIDVAPNLLDKAKSRLAGNNVYVTETDFDCLPNYDYAFDLVFSNMALHWSKDLNKTLAGIHSLLADDGVLAFTIPLTGTLQELENQFLLRDFFTNDDVIKMLRENKFEIIFSATEINKYLFADSLSALQSLKQIGATVTQQKVDKGLTGKSILQKNPIQQLSYSIGHYIVTKNR